MRMAFTAQSFVGKVIDISFEVIDMFKYIIKKILMMIPMLLVISFLIYYGMRASGVDPINFMVTPETLSQNSGNVEALRESLGLNDPLIVQYVRWLGDILHGNLGYSFDGTPVVTILKTRLPYTFELAGYSLVLSAILGIGIGIISAVRQNGIVDYVGRILAVLGQAIPQCLVGIILIEIFIIINAIIAPNIITFNAYSPVNNPFFIFIFSGLKKYIKFNATPPNTNDVK